MSSHLARRGGIWWARLAIPAKLREIAGRREFTQSCRTHELAIAKLVCAVLLADWRQQIFQFESRPMTTDVLRLVGGSHALAGGGHVSLNEAVRESGISQSQLMRAIADGTMRLFGRLSNIRGHVVSCDALDHVDVMTGPEGGFIVPQRQHMPQSALETVKTGLFPIGKGSNAVADAVLANGLEMVELVGFELDGQPGMLFVPDTVVTVRIGSLEVMASEVEAMRQRLAGSVSPDAVKRAQALQTASLLGASKPEGPRAQSRFSEALAAYATTSSGIPGNVTSTAEQRQKRRGCSLFIELVGDLHLVEITADRFREFREKLKTLPSKANNIPGQFRRATMAETFAALNDGGVKWPTMTVTAQHERLLWVGQMFTWLAAQGWVTENPTIAVLGEQTQTAAARKAQRQAAAARAETDVDDNRRAFTPDELKLIFSQAHYKTGHGAHVKGNARWYPFEFWLPLIALFSGSRIGEICQLRLDDIRQSEEGTWYFDINETTPDKSLKNANAVRQVPVSPVLVELGLIAYRDRLINEGYRRLFAELTYAKSDARYAKEPIRKMSAMLGSLGMPRDSTRVFHCLRANFNDAMLRVPFTSLPFDDPDLKRFIRLKVIGHKLEGVNENHYSSTTMIEKSALVHGVQYDLPVIATFDAEFAVNEVLSGLLNKKGRRRGMEDMGPLNSD